MKWFLITLAVLIAGWQAAIYFVNRVAASGNMAAVDSLQARAPIPDSVKIDTLRAGYGALDTVKRNKLALPKGSIDTKGVDPQQVVSFAKTLIGVPYRYGSTNPVQGLDCSGFVTHVFSRFDIVVPRSSIDFTHIGREVSAQDAKPGDLVLFTGTDSAERFVGHMGIIVTNSDSLRFIHATSGKQYGVTITPLNKYYQRRYVKTIRIFPENG